MSHTKITIPQNSEITHTLSDFSPCLQNDNRFEPRPPPRLTGCSPTIREEP
ncbi:hypothetical protein Hanom_Chr02g00160531 [Helianthus anomalus]